MNSFTPSLHGSTHIHCSGSSGLCPLMFLDFGPQNRFAFGMQGEFASVNLECLSAHYGDKRKESKFFSLLIVAIWRLLLLWLRRGGRGGREVVLCPG